MSSKNRNTLDFLAWSFKYLHLCHKSKELVILKLNFEKAFDKIEHQVIIAVMKHTRFLDRWINWIQDILTTGTSSILLNGVPDKIF
jgi:hypothetical protein